MKAAFTFVVGGIVGIALWCAFGGEVRNLEFIGASKSDCVPFYFGHDQKLKCLAHDWFVLRQENRYALELRFDCPTHRPRAVFDEAEDRVCLRCGKVESKVDALKDSVMADVRVFRARKRLADQLIRESKEDQ